MPQIDGCSTLQASLFGAQDGNGLSLVYYFTLPEGWEPNDVGNPAALEMLQRFIHDGREQDKYALLLVQNLWQSIAAGLSVHQCLQYSAVQLVCVMHQYILEVMTLHQAL